MNWIVRCLDRLKYIFCLRAWMVQKFHERRSKLDAHAVRSAQAFRDIHNRRSSS